MKASMIQKKQPKVEGRSSAHRGHLGNFSPLPVDAPSWIPILEGLPFWPIRKTGLFTTSGINLRSLTNSFPGAITFYLQNIILWKSCSIHFLHQDFPSSYSDFHSTLLFSRGIHLWLFCCWLLFLFLFIFVSSFRRQEPDLVNLKYNKT